MFVDAFPAEDRERSQERGREGGEVSGASQGFFDGANGLRSEVAGEFLLRDGREQSEQAKQLEGEGKNGIFPSFPAALQEAQGEIEDFGERFLVVEEGEKDFTPLFRHGELFDGECGRVIQALCGGDGPSGTALCECKGEVLVSQKVSAHAATQTANPAGAGCETAAFPCEQQEETVSFADIVGVQDEGLDGAGASHDLSEGA